jgi:hypothetical protein
VLWRRIPLGCRNRIAAASPVKYRENTGGR